jgi:hypothetical protein
MNFVKPSTGHPASASTIDKTFITLKDIATHEQNYKAYLVPNFLHPLQHKSQQFFCQNKCNSLLVKLAPTIIRFRLGVLKAQLQRKVLIIYSTPNKKYRSLILMNLDTSSFKIAFTIDSSHHLPIIK